jgi:hypothetical protein
LPLGSRENRPHTHGYSEGAKPLPRDIYR